MHHPNQGFLRKFLGTDKEYQAQQKAIQRKQEVAEYFENKEKNKTVLLEQDKKSINTVIEKVYKKNKKQNLFEQNLNIKDWKPIQTEHGIFYFNEKENLWMNNFGVIRPSLKDFTSIFDYDSSSKIQNKEPPQPPSELQAQMSISGVTLGWQDNSDNEIEFHIYGRRELI